MRIFFLLVISVTAYGQVIFEKGYFIDNNGKRTECFIKNSDWQFNPSSFNYRLDSSDVVKKGGRESVSEFGIGSATRFIRADVAIDTASTLLSNLTYDRNPNWSQQTIFLKVVIASKASLYAYENSLGLRLFYAVDGAVPKQLVYREYRILTAGGHTDIGVNNYFRQQLWNDVTCEITSQQVLEKIKYTKAELEKYFNNFNSCSLGIAAPVATAKKTNPKKCI